MGLNRIHATDTTTHQIEIDAGTKLHFQNNADRTAFALELGSGVPGNVTSVNSFTGAVVLGAGDIGLGNVENTALSTWPGSAAITSVGTLTLGTASTGFTIELGNVTVTGTLSGSKVSGGTFGAVNGSALTSLNASNISSGTLSDSRLATDVWRSGQSYTGNDTTTIFGGASGHPMRLYVSDYGILAINTQFAQFEINPLAVITQAANPMPDYNVWVSGTGGKLSPIANATTGKFFGAHTAAAPSWDNVTDALLVTSDVTTNNADTTKHGFLRKLDNNATHYLDGTGAWSSPAGGGWSRVSGSDFTNTTTTLNPVTGLSFAIGSSEVWHAEVVMSVVGGSSGAGLKFNVTAPSGATGLVLITGNGSSGSTQMENEIQASFGATPGKTFVTGSSLAGIVRMDLTVVNSTTAGNVVVQMGLSSASGTGTVKVNSRIVYAK